MIPITIREIEHAPKGTSVPEGAPNATVSFDRGPEYPITITDPFTEEEEKRLAWYFEKYLEFPFTDDVKYREAAASVQAYGHALFAQVFTGKALNPYYQARQGGVGQMTFEIAGSPEFHALHWEALKDPELPRAFALEGPMVRKNLQPRAVEAALRASPTINILVVTARPRGARDVASRTISRPLVESLRQAQVPARVEILRPGTYRALVEHLEAARGRGEFYHVVHFDVHGALLDYPAIEKGVEAGPFLYQTRYARKDFQPFEGLRAFLFLEGDADRPFDAVEADELAELLLSHQIPIVVLNACQSGMQVGDAETSLASRLMNAGVQVALGMGYSVTVSAAEQLMMHLYHALLAGGTLDAAVRRARLELFNAKTRRAYFNQRIDLEDWILPVVYQNRTVTIPVRAFTPKESAAHYERQAHAFPFPEPTYGFVGRDVDILQIEKHLLAQNNLLLVRGMGGAGKTTLLKHIGAWGQTTHFVDQVFYFGYDEKAHTCQQITHAIARGLLGEADYYSAFVPMSEAAQGTFLADKLRVTRHLLILDNLESVTGTHLAIGNALPDAERAALKGFLAQVRGGKTLVLFGSRGGENWLMDNSFVSHARAPLRAEDVYDLPGLDPEAASDLAEKILRRNGVLKYQKDKDFLHLLKLLDGFPLALEVVLANLKTQTPVQILEALTKGEEGADKEGLSSVPTNEDILKEKTQSILRCIDYSFSNISPEAQSLLACLAPFTGVIDIDPNRLNNYTQHLRAQPALAHLPFDRWNEVLQEAANWGLLAPHEIGGGYLRLQPIFPYFLRTRLQGEGESRSEDREAKIENQTSSILDLQSSIQTAFRQHYDGIGRALVQLMDSKTPQERQVGQALTSVEYENLITAINYGLELKTFFYRSFDPVYDYLRAVQDHSRALGLCQHVLGYKNQYSEHQLASEIGVDFYLIQARLATSFLEIKEYAKAEPVYNDALDTIANLQTISDEVKANYTAITYHQLGMVAQAQRQWEQAEGHYRQALQIKIEYNDRYSQALTYHQLGYVAQAQRQWAQAEAHYRQALQIKIEFNDRYSQASTYHQLGRVAEEQRQWAQAEGHYRQALQIKIEYNDRYSQASTYHQLGVVAQEQRQWGQAEGHYRQALQIFIEFNDRYRQASTYHQLGIVAQEQRQWAQAEGHYRQALQIYIEFNDRYEQAGTYHQLGRVAEAQRQWGQAEGHYWQALQIDIEFNDRYRQASTYHQLGMVAQAQRQWGQAEGHYRQALQIKIEFNDRYNQASTYGQLGLLAEAQEHWPQAQEHLIRALEIFVQFGNEHNTAQVIQILAGLHAEAGEALPGLVAAVAGVLGVEEAEAGRLLERGE